MLGSKIKGARCYVCFPFFSIEDTTSVPALEYMYFSSWGQAAQQDNKMDGMT